MMGITHIPNKPSAQPTAWQNLLELATCVGGPEIQWALKNKKVTSYQSLQNFTGILDKRLLFLHLFGYKNFIKQLNYC